MNSYLIVLHIMLQFSPFPDQVSIVGPMSQDSCLKLLNAAQGARAAAPGSKWERNCIEKRDADYAVAFYDCRHADGETINKLPTYFYDCYGWRRMLN